MFKKICICAVTIVVVSLTSFFTGSFTTKKRLMEQHRLELELSRARAAALTDTITAAREEVGGIRESLSRQRSSVAELRELIREVRTRYEKMEELLSSSGDSISDSDSNSNTSDGV